VPSVEFVIKVSLTNNNSGIHSPKTGQNVRSSSARSNHFSAQEHGHTHSAQELLDHLAFARDDVTGRIVDVRDVPRGLACNCTCISCGEQLVARQGEVVAWHFAHKANSNCSKSAEQGSLDAIAEMVCQLIAEHPTLELPSHVVEERVQEPGTKLVCTVHCPVAPITRLKLYNALPSTKPDEKQAGINLVADIDGYRLGVVLSRSQTAINAWCGIPDPRLGVVVFDLSYPARASCSNGESEISITRLANWISSESGGKNWVQHPREPLARARASQRKSAALRRVQKDKKSR